MLEMLGGMVVVLLVRPPFLVAAGGLLLLLAGIGPGTPRRARETFRCPWMGRVVTADFVVPEGAPYPSDVTACTAFENPARVTCRKPCRQVAEVRWGLSWGLFPRWALTAGGPVVWRTAGEFVPTK